MYINLVLISTFTFFDLKPNTALISGFANNLQCFYVIRKSKKDINYYVHEDGLSDAEFDRQKVCIL